MSKLSPFDYVRSISETKEKLEDLSGYAPYMINRALSLYPDLIFDVNIMNLFPGVTNQMHYDFYLNSIRKQKRYGKKWPKPEKDDQIQMIMNFYKYSKDKAKEALKILTEDDLEIIAKKLEKGGVK